MPARRSARRSTRHHHRSARRPAKRSTAARPIVCTRLGCRRLRPKRPSPRISATLLAAGSRMRGFRRSLWEVQVASNGVKRWVRV